jgi:hypothetical protein
MTYGIIVKKSGEIIGAEPVSLSDVKQYLNVTFDAHDTKLTRLITSIRESLEQFKNVTLIDERSVNVSWQTFCDDEPLPFLPIKAGTTVVVTDLLDVAIDASLFTLLDTGGFITFVGEFPNGVKLSYITSKQSISNNIKELLIRSVASCFESDMTPKQSVRKHFNYVEIY